MSPANLPRFLFSHDTTVLPAYIVTCCGERGDLQPSDGSSCQCLASCGLARVQIETRRSLSIWQRRRTPEALQQVHDEQVTLLASVIPVTSLPSALLTLCMVRRQPAAPGGQARACAAEHAPPPQQQQGQPKGLQLPAKILPSDSSAGAGRPARAAGSTGLSRRQAMSAAAACAGVALAEAVLLPRPAAAADGAALMVAPPTAQVPQGGRAPRGDTLRRIGRVRFPFVSAFQMILSPDGHRCGAMCVRCPL